MHSLGSSGSKGASRDVASAAAEQGPRVVLVAEPVTPEAPTSGTATGRAALRLAPLIPSDNNSLTGSPVEPVELNHS
jgi:hypothetical protein